MGSGRQEAGGALPRWQLQWRRDGRSIAHIKRFVFADITMDLKQGRSWRYVRLKMDCNGSRTCISCSRNHAPSRQHLKPVESARNESRLQRTPWMELPFEASECRAGNGPTPSAHYTEISSDGCEQEGGGLTINCGSFFGFRTAPILLRQRN